MPSTVDVYISGPLQAAEDLEAARSFYEQIANSCVRAGCTAYVPHQNTDPVLASALPASEVFQRDIHALLAADIVIAHIGRPSSGVGAEVGIAFERGKPVIGVHHHSEQPSRFLLGLLEDFPDARIIAFDSVADCCELIEQALIEFLPEGAWHSLSSAHSGRL